MESEGQLRSLMSEYGYGFSVLLLRLKLRLDTPIGRLLGYCCRGASAPPLKEPLFSRACQRLWSLGGSKGSRSLG